MDQANRTEKCRADAADAAVRISVGGVAEIGEEASKRPYAAPTVERLGSLSKVVLFSGGSSFF